MDREATEKNLQEMRDFSKQQKISHAKMVREQENCEERLNDKKRSLELKLCEEESLIEEAKRVADRCLDHEVLEGDPDYDYYAQAAEYAEGRLHPSLANKSQMRSWEELDDDLIELRGFLDPE